MKHNIDHWDSFFSDIEEREILGKFDYYPWRMTGLTDSNDPNSIIFWYKELEEFTELRVLLENKMKEHLKKDIQLMALYANGQTHSQCGSPHQDWHMDDGDPATYYTLLIYIHKQWKPIYGGHTIFMDNTGNEMIASIWPKSNTAVLFDSSIVHAGLEPTIHCKNNMRQSLAFKFKVYE